MPMRLRSELPSFDGATNWINGKIDAEQLENRPVLVHFWAVSCHMCKESLPLMSNWVDTYGKEYGLKVIGVHMPRSEKDTDVQAVEATVEDYCLEHPIAVDNTHAITDAFENEYVPAYYLFDRKHQLRHFQAGERGLKMVEQRLQRILGNEKEGSQ